MIGVKNDDKRRINELIGNVINNNIIPPIYPIVENKEINNKKIILVEIAEGTNKPYSTNKGIYLTKAGSDKRKISPQELRRLFAESKNLYPDEEIVHKTTIDDLDVFKLKKYLKSSNVEVLNRLNTNNLELKTILTNLELLRKGNLTLAGNLIFGETPQRFTPSFYIDCCYFDGNDVSVTKFISKKTLKGTLDQLYEDSMNFIISQLRSYQVKEDFNSNAELEINKEILTELIVNALVHRDYYINASIKIFIFHDRVEIISPGKLTDSLTVEKIKNGIAIQRNPILSSVCKNVLPYAGYGTGIKRILDLNDNIEFLNNIEIEQFKSIVYRKKLGVNEKKLGVNEKKLGVNEKKLGVNLSKSKKMILDLIKQEASITISSLSNKVGISTTAIEKNIKQLKQKNILKRIGSDKSGTWEII